MSNTFARIIIGASTLAVASIANAGVIYDSGGFEAPRFLPAFVNPLDPTVIGNLRGQDAPVSVRRESTTDPTNPDGANAGTAIVEPITGGVVPDLQDVKVTRTQYDNRWAPIVTYTQNATFPIVNIDWSEKVTQTVADPTKFGPFFGIEGYDTSSGPILGIGGLGVDATTGELLYEAGGQFNITPLDATVPFDQYNNFEMSLNYSSKTYSISLNGNTLVTAIPFLTAGVTGLTDADISALQADAVAFNNAGTAYFDNYTITAVGIPEPASVSLLAITGAVLCARRRRMATR